MTQAKQRFRSLEEYAALDPSELPEGNYELVNGVIVEMGAENLQNVEIAGFLYLMLAQIIPYYLIHRGTEIAVSSRLVTSRYPDLMVLTEETRAVMKRDKRSLIALDMPAPRLVIEVVSPGEPGSKNYKRDYIEKRSEYAGRGIPEYWLIDPENQRITVLKLVERQYTEHGVFRGSDRINSPTFGLLQLTVEQVLSAGQ